MSRKTKTNYRDLKRQFQRREREFREALAAREAPQHRVWGQNIIVAEPKPGWVTVEVYPNALYLARRYTTCVHVFIDHPEWANLAAGMPENVLWQPLLDWLREQDVGDAEFKSVLGLIQDAITDPPDIDW